MGRVIIRDALSAQVGIPAVDVHRVIKSPAGSQRGIFDQSWRSYRCLRADHDIPARTASIATAITRLSSVRNFEFEIAREGLHRRRNRVDF